MRPRPVKDEGGSYLSGLEERLQTMTDDVFLNRSLKYVLHSHISFDCCDLKAFVEPRRNLEIAVNTLLGAAATRLRLRSAEWASGHLDLPIKRLSGGTSARENPGRGCISFMDGLAP
jgi:hypothetical protein